MAPEHAERFYQLYLAAFGPLRTRAVARQVLHHDEFLAEMVDPRVWKYVAWDDGDHPVGLATLTRDLEVVPWISPEYFAERYPAQAARSAIYYLGFILVHPHRQREQVFSQILQAGVEQLRAAEAVCAYDICEYNDAVYGFGSRIEGLLHELADVTVERVDTQTYYSATFEDPRSRNTRIGGG